MLIRCENLSFEKEGKLFFENLNFEIREGEKIVLLGLNGSGKTTLLKVLNALCFATSGSYAINDVEITKKSFTKDFEKGFRAKCAKLFQNFDAMFFCKSLGEDIEFTPMALGLSEPTKRRDDEATFFGLSDRVDEFAFNLSGGERQRGALACVFAVRPELLLLDEPTSALDPYWVGRLAEKIALCKQTVITATHNLSMASELGSRAIVMKDGHIIYDGDTKAFLGDKTRLIEAGLVHSHAHTHPDGSVHEHFHTHDFY